MRIRRITVRNYAGIDEAEVTFPDSGVTIIEGVNEAGKTSLVAALNAILEYPDSSGSKKITAIVPVGRDVGPEVEVELVTGEYEFTYSKRWKKGRETVLEMTRPVREQLVGRDAHDRVEAILTETLDTGLWRALRIDQGAALGQANFEVPALGRALDAAIGGDVAGDDEDALWTRIEDEYARYWTATGRPKAELSAAADELAEARSVRDEADAHMGSLDADAEEIDRLKDRAASLREAQVDAARTVESMADQVDAVARVRGVLQQAGGELERASAIHQKAHNDRQRRDEQVATLEAATGELQRITEELARSSPEREALVSAAEQAGLGEDEARTKREEGQSAFEQARADTAYRRRQIEVAQLTERRNRVVDAQEQLVKADEVVDSITIDAGLLDEIEEAHLELAKLRAAAERALPGVTVRALTDVDIVIDADAVAMTADEERTLVVDATSNIVVPDVVEITVTAGTDGADVAGGLEDADARYGELCRRGNATGLADARAKADRRADALRVRENAVETIARDLRDLTLEALSNKIDRLNHKITEFESTRAATPPIPHDLTDAQDAERSAEDAVAAAKDAAGRAEDRARSAAARLGEFDLGHVRLKAQLEIAESTV
ncbi:MAG: AAA family ATPase, partial [Actinomycetia bacterium]|nr:AAA family ATPase [Actinomycetes bacterium]